MKNTIAFFTTALILQSFSCYGVMTTGFITRTETINGITEQSNLNYASQIQNYVNGGLTFTYPVDWFTIAPVVKVSVEPTSATPSNATYTAEITSNSATETIITVKLISTTLSVVSVTEAATDSVKIHLFTVQAIEEIIE